MFSSFYANISKPFWSFLLLIKWTEKNHFKICLKFCFSFDGLLYICTPQKRYAQVAKLVDAPSSGGGAARCDGSNPFLGTKAL